MSFGIVYEWGLGAAVACHCYPPGPGVRIAGAIAGPFVFTCELGAGAPGPSVRFTGGVPVPCDPTCEPSTRAPDPGVSFAVALKGPCDPIASLVPGPSFVVAGICSPHGVYVVHHAFHLIVIPPRCPH